MTELDAYFDAVYRDTHDDLIRYLVIKTRRASDVEDVLQTAYQRFYARILKRGRDDVETPKAFLLTLVKRELWKRSALLTRRGTETALPEDIASDAPPPDEAAFLRIGYDAVWDCVKSEPLLSYKCFTLHYGYDMPVGEIAVKLGVTEDAVKQRLYRTRQRLRRVLAENQPEGNGKERGQ